MARSIHERVRATLAAQDKARKAAIYKSGESARRSDAARMSAAERHDARIDAICSGDAEPRTARERAIADRAMLRDLGIDHE